MIAALDGKIISKTPDTVILDVRGVGYEVLIPLSTYYKLPEVSESARLQIHTCIKDDAIILNGFWSLEEKEIFLLMIGVTGIGPKLARNILSGISVEDFKGAVVAGDIPVLVKVPGLGKKTAGRLILELSDKLKKLVIESSNGALPLSTPPSIDGDVVSALVNLGYKEARAQEALAKAKPGLGEEISFEKLFKTTLKLLSGK